MRILAGGTHIKSWRRSLVHQAPALIRYTLKSSLLQFHTLRGVTLIIISRMKPRANFYPSTYPSRLIMSPREPSSVASFKWNYTFAKQARVYIRKYLPHRGISRSCSKKEYSISVPVSKQHPLRCTYFRSATVRVACIWYPEVHMVSRMQRIFSGFKNKKVVPLCFG